MTHIAVDNGQGQQLVTIDMPMDEAKRITVRQNVTVVENREFCDCTADGKTVSHCPAPKHAAQAEDKTVKPIVVPSGVAKPVSTVASAVVAKPPKSIVIPASSGPKPEPAAKSIVVPISSGPKPKPIIKASAKPECASDKKSDSDSESNSDSSDSDSDS